MTTDATFPTIGAVATQTEVSDGGDEKVVQEVESLCMKCGEQVCSYLTHFAGA